jgi:DNA (cytosine-5)-methyltransferase 1
VSLTLIDFFCGAGGSSQGAHAVPGVEVKAAANHWQRALESHEANFPATRHYQGDIRDMNMSVLPRGDIFWASPECPQWSQARGVQRDYDRQPDLFGETLPDEAAERSRALMWDVPRYLDAMKLRGEPVLAGVVENVTDVRQWDRWREWTGAIAGLGYRTKLIALNSMHARPRVTLLAPQSRDRLYLAYWLTSLGRDPDWDKWLRPQAWCPSCGEVVTAVQLFKRAGNDMGRYRQQYRYHCARFSCRGQVVEPGALPAAAAIDWDHPGTRIGDRDRPLSPKTLARIRAGFERYARPITLEAGGNTFERRPGVRTWPADQPLTTLMATETKGVAVPPVIAPAGGTWRDEAQPVTDPMGTRTTRENDGIAVPPFVTVNRGGEGDLRTSAIDGPLSSVTTAGTQHALVAPPFISMLRGPHNPPTRIDEPMATLMTGNNHYLTCPPFLTPLRSGRPRTILAGSEPMATVVADGGNHGLVQPGGRVPLSLLMRNNSSRSGDGAEMSTPVSEPARALTTAGHQSLVTWADILVPYYGTGVAHDVEEPVGTLSTRDRFALVSGAFSIEDALFRMLEPREIGRAMAFGGTYTVLGNKREKTRQYGNAVTPPVAEVIVSALVECITGEDLPPGADLGRDAA